jgi:hypothetical protein|tara:strand:+ start:271 stop:453 length:183 start_codon:yes stop_codon:yes gene_type:complete
MKDYMISNLQDAEKYIISALDTNQARHFVINYLDCSKDWNISPHKTDQDIKIIKLKEGKI